MQKLATSEVPQCGLASSDDEEVNLSDESAQIAFVLECVAGEAISMSEMRDWADSVISTSHEVSQAILDLSTFDGFLKDVDSVIGINLDRDFSDQERDAFQAIAIVRGNKPYERTLSDEEAARVVKERSEIVEEFKKTFPFLEIKNL